jgi:hypothetical protein
VSFSCEIFSLSFLLLSFLLFKPPTLSLFCATHSISGFSSFYNFFTLANSNLGRENSYLLRNSLRSTHFIFCSWQLCFFLCRCIVAEKSAPLGYFAEFIMHKQKFTVVKLFVFFVLLSSLVFSFNYPLKTFFRQTLIVNELKCTRDFLNHSTAEICLVCFLNKFSIVKRKIARKSWKSVILFCFSRPARFLHAVNTTLRCNVEIIRKLNLFKFFSFFFTRFAQLTNLIHLKFSPNHTKIFVVVFISLFLALCAILRDEV